MARFGPTSAIVAVRRARMRRVPASPEDRLDSWKEIAAYLNRGVRTVRRWEREEGLPVHRHASRAWQRLRVQIRDRIVATDRPTPRAPSPAATAQRSRSSAGSRRSPSCHSRT